MTRRLCALSVLVLAMLARVAPAAAAGGSPESNAELAQKYAPVFYFHAAELFRPQPAEVILEQARMRQSRTL